MNLFLTLAFLFFVGSVLGWVIELFFRRAISSKWINPGFCMGPYLPLYGCGLCFMYLIASIEKYSIIRSPVLNKIVLFIIMAVCMTFLEFVAGLICVKIMKVSLWDYSDEWGNVMGLICPKYSFFWAILGAVYYFAIHPHVLDALNWLSKNLAFSFVIGLFFGIFAVDFVQSAQLAAKIKAFADENDIVVKYENLKLHIRAMYEKTSRKYHFFRPFYSEQATREHLKETLSSFERLIHR